MFGFAISVENDKGKILEILGRVSEKMKLDKLKAKYKELYGKVRICIFFLLVCRFFCLFVNTLRSTSRS